MLVGNIRNKLSANLSLGARRTILCICLSAACTLTWLLIAIGFDLWGRISDLWPASITMIFGSIVAGSTPQGGGVVAFPVFTKVLSVPPEVARTFSLCIQSVGMTVGAAWIVINRRPVEWKSVLIMTPAAAIGLWFTGTLATSTELPFRPAVFSAPFVKVTFTIVLIAMAFVVYEANRIQKRETRKTLPAMNGRVFGLLVFCGVLGGAASGLVGSGADVLLFVAVVLILDVDPKVGVPTSVVCMAIISLLGMIQFGILDGQLMVSLDAVGNVTGLNGNPVTFERGQLVYGSGIAAPAGKYDLLGLWLACIPVVVWGAPIGTWIAANLNSRNLVRFVTLLALLEGLTTVIFLKSLRTDMILLVYFVLGIVLTILFLRCLANRREQIFRVLSQTSPE